MTSSASNQRRRYNGGDASNQRCGCNGGDAHGAGNASTTVAAASSTGRHWVTPNLLVLHFLIEFANIWAQYCPWTYASTHVGFCLLYTSDAADE